MKKQPETQSSIFDQITPSRPVLPVEAREPVPVAPAGSSVVPAESQHTPTLDETMAFYFGWGR